MKCLTTYFFTVTLALGMVLVTGCDTTSSTSGDGTVSVKFTDSQSSAKSFAKNAEAKHTHDEKTIRSAVVTIGEVEVVAVEDTSEEEAGGPSALPADTFEVDLIDLQNGVDEYLSENGTEIPSGTYGQLRLITTEEVAVTFEDETTSDVRIASGQQTGLKVNFDPITLDSEDDRAEITLDFDVQESLHGSPQGEWVITPVVSATATVTSDSETSEE